MKKYKYVGDGIGVPGLPHEVTEEEATELGVLDVLNEAVKNGNYVEVDEDPHPVPLPFRERGAKKEKE